VLVVLEFKRNKLANALYMKSKAHISYATMLLNGHDCVEGNVLGVQRIAQSWKHQRSLHLRPSPMFNSSPSNSDIAVQCHLPYALHCLPSCKGLTCRLKQQHLMRWGGGTSVDGVDAIHKLAGPPAS
jgi:hypothetical protein